MYLHTKIFKMVCLKGFEPLARGLEGHCSILLSYRHTYGAGEGDRTLATGLEGRGSTTELHPHKMVEEIGFEPM